MVGEGGLGKSFMLKRVLNRYPKSWTLGRTISPAVRVSLTDGMKPSDLERAILKELGDIAERKAPDPSRRQLVVNSLRECGSRVLLLDEAQKLALVKGARSDDRAAGPLGDYLKDLYDTACIAIVMAGTKSLQAVVKQDPQLRTRWGGEILLERYTIDDDQWKSLLLALSRVLPMPESTDLLPASTALLTASSGNLRQLKVLVSEAVRLASREGAMCLKVQHLAKAYAVLSFPVPTPFK